MTVSHDGHAPPKRRPGPKPRGRTVVPLTITVTPEQRSALAARADAEKRSISAVVREFIATGLAPGMLSTLCVFIVITVACQTGQRTRRAAQSQ
jgi:hypothetical protein